MSYASFVVHVDQAAYPQSLAAVALRLAVDFDAHVTALHTYMPSYYASASYADLHAWSGLESALREEEEESRQRDAEFKTRFETQARESGSSKAEWDYVIGEPMRTVATRALYADMALMGQLDPDRAAVAGEFDTPAQVALLSGRPVLVVPYAGSFDVIGKRVAIAWKSTREAARAVAAALPLLARAQSVDILTIGEDGRSGADSDDSAGTDITLYLARHGIKSSISRIPKGDIRISEMLLSTIADRGTDLLCMGAYGHSRFRQLVLGGVTSEIMRHMTVPTLITG